MSSRGRTGTPSPKSSPHAPGASSSPLRRDQLDSDERMLLARPRSPNRHTSGPLQLDPSSSNGSYIRNPLRHTANTRAPTSSRPVSTARHTHHKPASTSTNPTALDASSQDPHQAWLELIDIIKQEKSQKQQHQPATKERETISIDDVPLDENLLTVPQGQSHPTIRIDSSDRSQFRPSPESSPTPLAAASEKSFGEWARLWVSSPDCRRSLFGLLALELMNQILWDWLDGPRGCEILEWSLSALVLLYCLVKRLVLGRSFKDDRWNYVEVALATGSFIADIAGAWKYHQTMMYGAPFRLLMFATLDSSRECISKFAVAARSLTGVVLTSVAVFFAFAIFGKFVFGDEGNFGSVLEGLYTLFRLITFDDAAKDIVLPLTSKNHYAWWYIFAFYVVASYLLLNLALAIVVDVFTKQVVSTYQEVMLSYQDALLLRAKRPFKGGDSAATFTASNLVGSHLV